MFSLINIVGLGLAMSFCLLVLIQVQASFERDTFHPYPKRTYRITTEVINQDGDVSSLASTPLPLGAKLAEEQSSIEKSARVIRAFNATPSNRVKSLDVHGYFADSAYFDIFGFRLDSSRFSFRRSEPLLNKDFPPPRTVGFSTILYRSTSPRLMKLAAISAPPHITISLPGCFFS